MDEIQKTSIIICGYSLERFQDGLKVLKTIIREFVYEWQYPIIIIVGYLTLSLSIILGCPLRLKRIDFA